MFRAAHFYLLRFIQPRWLYAVALHVSAIVVRLFSGRVNINDIAIEWSFVSCSQVHIIFAYAKPKNRQSACACSDFHLGDSLAWTQISIQNLHRFVCILCILFDFNIHTGCQNVAISPIFFDKITAECAFSFDFGAHKVITNID